VKVVSKDGATAALTFIPDEVKPLGGYYLLGVIAAIAQRYGFGKSPTYQEVTTSGARFHHGHLVVGQRDIAINELGFYNDAVGVTTTDTKDSEVVLKDLVAWLKATYKFRDPTTPFARAYQSDLVVEFDNDPSDALRAFDPLIKFLGQQREKLGQNEKVIGFHRLAFGADPMVPGPNADFLVERRSNMPWEGGRYFSKAHLPTDVHIEALKLFDDLLGKKR
jgi:hypothetical protein